MEWKGSTDLTYEGGGQLKGQTKYNSVMHGNTWLTVSALYSRHVVGEYFIDENRPMRFILGWLPTT